MLCSSCQSAYSPTPEQLGHVDSLEGLCDRCGTEPRLRRFALAFIEGAVAGVIALELLLLLLLFGGWQAALIPPIVVAAICIAIYSLASRSEPVRYADEEHRRKATTVHRAGGRILGFAVGLGAILVFLSVQ